MSIGLTRILLVEDDRSAADLAIRWLTSASYDVVWESNGRRADELLSRQTFDLVILDIGLPGIDGLELLSRLRRRAPGTAIIMLTARTSEPDTIRGLRLGADDYLGKPFSPGELLARVEAVMRRTAGDRLGVVEAGALVVDLDARRATVGGEPLELSRTEFDLLALLASRRGVALSREVILSEVWAMSPSGKGFALLNEYISRIRRQLPEGSITTIRGVGYRYDGS